MENKKKPVGATKKVNIPTKKAPPKKPITKKIRVASAVGMTQAEKIKANKELLISELEKTSGIIAYACKNANIRRQTYYDWYKSDPEFREKADDISEGQIDVAEASLLKKLQGGDTTAIIFYLKTKGKTRGYVETRVIEGNVSTTIKNADEVLKNLSDEQREALLNLADELDEQSE